VRLVLGESLTEPGAANETADTGGADAGGADTESRPVDEAAVVLLGF